MDNIYVGGTWVPTEGTGRIEVYNPATEEVVARVPDGTPADVDRAVRAARAAFPAWSALTRSERAKHLGALRDALTARAGDLAATVTREMGAPAALAQRVQVALPITVLSSYVDALGSDAPDERIGNSLVLREPVGVVGAITPWNYPLHQAMAKIAPAL